MPPRPGLTLVAGFGVAVMMIVPVHHAVVMGPVAVGADALDMMVVADLGRADVVLETDDLFAVLAKRAVHGVVAVQGLGHPVDEGVNQQVMVVEVGRIYEFDLRMDGRRRVGHP